MIDLSRETVSDKMICPYCGSEMTVVEQETIYHLGDVPEPFVEKPYLCNNCAALLYNVHRVSKLDSIMI